MSEPLRTSRSLPAPPGRTTPVAWTTSTRVRRRRRTAIDAAILFVVVLLMAQMWLLTATLESFLAGHAQVASPALLTSAVLFGACFALYRVIVRLDRVPEPTEEPRATGPWDIV